MTESNASPADAEQETDHTYTNALVGETSPYLLQHAHNPVDWRPWGEAAFTEAREQNKPIFLSIGYSTCYWCHVMERQCFENEAIAAQMNEDFVSIKVDREERPDVDDIYMTAVQAMTGSGGWPMSVFLTPPGANGEGDSGLKPFFAGTYFPPQDAHGRPGFPTVLQSLHDAWVNRHDEVLEQSERVAEAVRSHLGRTDEPAAVTMEMVGEVASQILTNYDHTHGGFGGAPKFPQPATLDFLIAVHQNNPEHDVWSAVAHTLDRMAQGGMYDQVGGGFHRYSTDARWLVPHFEKMLYDNGQLAVTYAHAHQIGPPEEDPERYARIAKEICDYVIRDMTDATGAFWSAEDAEVDAREGGSYLWTEDKVRAAIDDDELADLAVVMYGLDQGTNFQDPHFPDDPPQNVLYLPKPLRELADERGVALARIITAKRKIDHTLLQVREQRKQPGTDDKVLTSWNGMMIEGMATVGRVLEEQKYLDAAVAAANAILEHMQDEHGLLHSMREGEAKIPGFLEDYAMFTAGLLALHDATQDQRWLDEAKRLTDLAIDKFTAEKGGYFDTLEGQADLFVRTRSLYDGATPSGNSQMIHNLVTLHERTGEMDYLTRAVGDLRSFATALRRQGANMTHMQHAAIRAMGQASDRMTAGQPPRPQSERRQPLRVGVDPPIVRISNEQSAEITIALEVDDDYHLNAHDPGDEDLMPTTVELIDGDGLSLDVDYPDPKTKQFPFADGPINVYEGALRITATLRGAPREDQDPKLVLKVQICTNESCLQPQQAQLPVQIEPAP